MTDESTESAVPEERIARCIHVVRGCKVILDEDLADPYQVENRALNQAVSRNKERFPEDFLFRLEPQEWAALRSQIVISKGRGGRRYAPYAFTEQGVAMLSSVLRSKRAIRVNIQVMRTFVRLRHLIATHEELSRKLDALERRYDGRFRVVFEAIRQLMEPPPESNERIGFR